MSGWVAGGMVLGSVVSSRASSKAASTQAASAEQAAEVQKNVSDEQIKLQREQFNRQVELQQEQFNRQVELQAPFRQSGLAAQNRLLTLLGINPPQDPVRPSGGGGGGFGSIAGGIGAAARAAFAQQQGPGLQVDPNSPDFGKYARDFAMSDFQADPGYAFRMSEGMKGLERSAAARGGLLSGSTLKGIQRFGQDLASQEYQNAFNRYGVERDRQLNPLQSLAGVGQTSAQQVGAAGQNLTQQVGAAGQNMASGIGNALGAYGQGAAQALGAGGQARASGYVGQANSLTGALGQYMNYNQQQQQNALLRQAIGNRSFGGGGYNVTEPYPGFNADIGIR
jgi:hypothetical protein